MKVLRLCSELNPTDFADLSKNSSGFLDAVRQRIVFHSGFHFLYWQGGFVSRGLRFTRRVSVYDSVSKQRIAYFDKCRYPINDITFHPTQPILAISAGDYDGGYLFEGELWLWNYETGQARNLLTENRTALQSYFRNNNELVTLLRPPDEGDFSGSAWGTYDCITIRDIEQLIESEADKHTIEQHTTYQNKITDPQSIGFSNTDLSEQKEYKVAEELLQNSSREELSNKRPAITHLYWIAATQLLTVSTSNQLEIWDTVTRQTTVITVSGQCVQLLNTPNGMLCHTLQENKSVLYRLVGHQLERVHSFENKLVFSTDAKGNLLGRNAAGKTSHDVWLNHSLQIIGGGDLGHFDCFNHALMLENGGDGLYFLQGTPATSHEKKQLCHLDLDGSVTPIMTWDREQRHNMQSIACWRPNRTLLRAFKVHAWEINQGACKIECCDITADKILWSLPCTSLCVAMDVIGEEFLAYALADGSLGLISVAAGRRLYEEKLSIDGVDCMATTLAAHGQQLAVGTLSGRLLLFDLTDFEAGDRLQEITARQVYSQLAASIKQIR